MTNNDCMTVARKAVAEFGQAEVARRIRRSPGSISQLMSGKYPNPEHILELIEAEFDTTTVNCPILGEIHLADCLDARRRAELPFFPSSSQAADLHQACPKCQCRRTSNREGSYKSKHGV